MRHKLHWWCNCGDQGWLNCNGYCFGLLHFEKQCGIITHWNLWSEIWMVFSLGQHNIIPLSHMSLDCVQFLVISNLMFANVAIAIYFMFFLLDISNIYLLAYLVHSPPKRTWWQVADMSYTTSVYYWDLASVSRKKRIKFYLPAF